MTDKTTEPFYRDDDKKFCARPVSDEDMACWEEFAAQSISHMVPGGINWPMIVRSLIEEIKSLKHDNAMLMEAATKEANNG